MLNKEADNTIEHFKGFKRVLLSVIASMLYINHPIICWSSFFTKDVFCSQVYVVNLHHIFSKWIDLQGNVIEMQAMMNLFEITTEAWPVDQPRVKICGRITVPMVSY